MLNGKSSDDERMQTYQVTRVTFAIGRWRGLDELNFQRWFRNMAAEQNLFKLVWSVNFFGQVEEVDDISGWDDSIFRRFDRAEKKNVIESQ